MAPQIVFKHVTYSYSPKQPRVDQALSDVSFRIKPGAFTVIVGQTGSGKSTLVQQINGLLKPTRGLVTVGSIQIKSGMSIPDVESVRRQVGLVFQIPQNQLFGETVRNDLAFGPINFGFSPVQIKKNVRLSADALGLDNLMNQSPFDLSGGQMKRVAIAGVIACRPQVLILDEPTVGLDNFRTNRIMDLIKGLQDRLHLTVIMVTHQMNLVAKYATQVLVLNRGRLIADVTPDQLFGNPSLLKRAGLSEPFAPRFAQELSRDGINLAKLPLDMSQLVNEIVKALKMRRYRG